jgi:hypothetical protein
MRLIIVKARKEFEGGSTEACYEFFAREIAEYEAQLLIEKGCSFVSVTEFEASSDDDLWMQMQGIK